MLERDKKCPKCGRKTLDIIRDDKGSRGTCSVCKYFFDDKKTNQTKPGERAPVGGTNSIVPNLLKTVNKFGGIIALFAIILSIVIMTQMGSQIALVDSNMILVANNLDARIKENATALNNIALEVDKNDIDINNMLSRLATAETDIVNLNTLQTTITALSTRIDAINTSIANLTSQVALIDLDTTILDTTTATAVFTFYPSQPIATTARYCELEVTVGNTAVGMNEVVYGFRYDNVDITLTDDWTSKIKPQEYKWDNGGHFDNYQLTWFEQTTSVYAKFNIAWDTSIYNSTSLVLTGLEDNLKVNGVFIDTVVSEVTV